MPFSIRPLHSSIVCAFSIGFSQAAYAWDAAGALTAFAPQLLAAAAGGFLGAGLLWILKHLHGDSGKRRAHRLGRVNAFQSAILEVARHPAVNGGDLVEAHRTICRIATEKMNVAQAGVWLLNGDQTQLSCQTLFNRVTAKYDQGSVLDKNDLPAYFKAVTAGRYIDAGAACVDERTREFAESYLKPQNIGALLDAPIRVAGELIGVLCLEHIGSTRVWSVEEISFAVELADQVAQAMLNTERRRLALRDRLAAQVFEHTIEAIMICDADYRIVSINPAFTTLTGWTLDEVQHRQPSILRPEQQDDFFNAMWDAVRHAGQWEGEVWIKRNDGSLFPSWLSLSMVKEGDDRAIGHCVGLFSDISKLKQAQADIRHMAHHDSLTGLPNRVLLTDRLQKALQLALRHKRKLALLFIDIDRFKTINDSLGHQIGDELLLLVAERLAKSLRAADTLARLGGDEFVVVLEDIEDSHAVARIVEKLRRHLHEPLSVGGHTLQISSSVGVSIYPDDGEDAMTLMKHADMAMYHVKGHGRDGFMFFLPEMNVNVHDRLDLEQQLRYAIENDQLEVHYQPQFELGKMKLVGMEALVRWRHPERGLISPARFIPIAEETGLITELGEWMLRHALRQAVQWREQGLPLLTLGVNLSPRQFRHGKLHETILTILEETGFDPGSLELEITEGVLMENIKAAIDTMERLSQLGIRIAIDDFGTGYSSLAYLKTFPLTRLKIDQSFVRDITTDHNDAAISKTVITLAHSLGLAVIAEGIETHAQLDFLMAHGCDEGQGYYFNKPIPAAEFEAFCRNPVPIAIRKGRDGDGTD